MKKSKKQTKEKDSAYVLKLILYFLLGSLWLKITKGGGDYLFPLPFGFLIGLLFISHEHFQIDRKIEYAILVGSMFASYWLPLGLLLSL